MFSILAAAIEITGDNGEMVKIGYAPFVVGVLPFVFILVALVLIIFYFFFKRRLEHKQILAAIEKGMPLAELRPAKPIGQLWIKNLTAGITLLIITLGIICIAVLCRDEFDELEDLFGYFIVAVILFAFGVSRLIRGLLQRKSEKQIPISNTKELEQNSPSD